MRGARTAGDDRRILVLDDSPPYLDFMRILLHTEGFAVVTATTAAAAQRQLRCQRCDLIITEGLLPGLEPFAILDVLKQEPTTAGLPIVLCSGAVRELVGARARLERQGIAVVEKPFDIDALLAQVTALLPAGSGSPSLP